MQEFDQDDWLAQRLRILRPGWRGRLRLLPPEEAKGQGYSEMIGTIVEEPAFDDDEADVEDPTITLCANHRAGHFVPIAGEPRFNIRVSRITAIEPM